MYLMESFRIELCSIRVRGLLLCTKLDGCRYTAVVLYNPVTPLIILFWYDRELM
jgi:hypothetical protein